LRLLSLIQDEIDNGLLTVAICCRILPKRCSIMAKKELQWAPLLGQFMTLSGAVFVDRSNNKDAVKSLAAAGEDMKSKQVNYFTFTFDILLVLKSIRRLFFILICMACF